jgi:hypothetical protein
VKILLILPTGVAWRNFVLGNFIPELLKQNELVILHALPEAFIQDQVERFGPRVQWLRLPKYREGALRYTLRRVFLWGHMRAGNTQAMQLMLAKSQPKGLSSLRAISEQFAWLVSKAFSTPARVRKLVSLHNWLLRFSPAPKAFEKIFHEQQPEIILCADQRPVIMAAAVKAARNMKIPIGTYIFSWDNLSSKGRMPTDYDFYLVWSQLMKQELLQFYPHLRPESIHITGSLQFEVYTDPAFYLSREEFCAMIGADPARPILCCAGEDFSTVPDGEKHPGILARLIREQKIHHNPQLVARPAPIDPGERYQAVLQQYPEILWCPPRWLRQPGAGWGQAVGTREDVILLTNLIRHSSMCINVTSTMTIDFAILGKPTVNIAFDASQPPAHGKPVWEVLFKFEHYRNVLDLKAVQLAFSEEELAQKINLYLEYPGLDEQARQRLVELEIALPLEQTSARFANALVQVAAQPKS